MKSIFLVLPVALFLVSSILPSRATDVIKLEKMEDRVRVTYTGLHFTDYIFAGRAKPIFHPINALTGPDGKVTRVTRDFPLKETPGEARDHPHHEGLWYAHGDVNGIDYWHLGEDKGRIVQTSLETKWSTIMTENEWRKPDGTVQLTDSRRIQFSVRGSCGPPVMRFEITLKASHGDVTFGDTKEGTFGLRMHPNLRLRNGNGVTTANGQAFNSEGVKGTDMWGKPAKWLTYWGKIDDKDVSIILVDHVANPQHPTPWHARDYGLVAANPFGLGHFNGKRDGSGRMTIKNGESVTFRYMFSVGAGHVPTARAADVMWRLWTRAWEREQAKEKERTEKRTKAAAAN